MDTLEWYNVTEVLKYKAAEVVEPTKCHSQVGEGPGTVRRRYGDDAVKWRNDGLQVVGSGQLA